MIVYADREERVDTCAFLRTIEQSADPLERLIRRGQFESGVSDALCPDCDDVVDFRSLPTEIVIRPPEGYAFYAVYPDQYRDAAKRFYTERRPEACVVIGIRSIGASLSTVVAEALPNVAARFTVRPRGHPFDRHICLSPRLELLIRENISAWFCIVDEGPGLSGSSFISVAEKLSEFGVPDERIVFFPSYEPHIAGLRSERARTRWPRHPVYLEPFRADRVVPAGGRDMSAGKWREILMRWPAANPQHERRKYLVDGCVWKFAGLAHLGRARFERARILSEAGFAPTAVAFENGFLISEFVQPDASAPDVDRIADYLAFLRREFATSRRVPYASLTEMIRVNAGIESPESDPVIEDAVVVALDGRMLPHEWIGDVKTDSVDHHDDHFFPGCQDIAWDIAGAEVEFETEPGALASRYLRLCRDATLDRRLPFYRRAYLAYRIGYAHLSAESLAGTADGARFGVLKNRYFAALAE
jgi:hypothetical protein